MDANEPDLIANFCAVTGASPSNAQTALESANWNLQEAVALWYAAQEEHQENDEQEEEEEDDEISQSTTAATPAVPAASSSSRKPPAQRSNRMTLDDLKKREEQSEEEEDENKGPDMFAGGEKSGLAVQNPGQAGGSGGPVDHFKNIMNQARQNRDRPAGTSEPENAAAAPSTRSSAFTGRAQTLGGDEAPSEVVEDPRAMAQARQQQQATQRVTRTLHLWADGVSIDDGPLFRFDDPANANIMAEINRGRAPLALLDVQPDQEVDLNLEPHKDENYVKPKQKWKPFSGGGQRLGSPVPSAGTSSSAPALSPAPASSSSSSAAAPAGAPELDDSAPTVNLQIRLGDGTRLTSRFNTTHTIGDVYAFVNAASPASAQRSYALMTTFPSKELGDKEVVLGDMEEFKKGRGGVVMQKWT